MYLQHLFKSVVVLLYLNLRNIFKAQLVFFLNNEIFHIVIRKTSIISRLLLTITYILERPRKIGAKYTGASFAPDEFSQPELKHDYEGKRDRWNGYNNEEYTVGFTLSLVSSRRRGLDLIKSHILVRSSAVACINIGKNGLCSILCDDE